MYLTHALHDGSPWLVLACLTTLVGVVMGVFTERGSGIAVHPYTRAEDGGELASDLPAESIGRPEFEPVLWGHARRVEPRTSHRWLIRAIEREGVNPEEEAPCSPSTAAAAPASSTARSGSRNCGRGQAAAATRSRR